MDPQQWNLYSYCGNNPTSYFDPDGRVRWKALGWAVLDTVGAGFGVGASVVAVGSGGGAPIGYIGFMKFGTDLLYGASNIYNAIAEKDAGPSSVLEHVAQSTVSAANQKQAASFVTAMNFAIDIALLKGFSSGYLKSEASVLRGKPGRAITKITQDPAKRGGKIADTATVIQAGKSIGKSVVSIKKTLEKN